jgi:hypothetical protein
MVSPAAAAAGDPAVSTSAVIANSSVPGTTLPGFSRSSRRRQALRTPHLLDVFLRQKAVGDQMCEIVGDGRAEAGFRHVIRDEAMQRPLFKRT